MSFFTSSTEPRSRRRWPRVLAVGFVSLATVVLIFMVEAWEAFGEKPSGERLERIGQSPQFHNGRFRNGLPTVSDGFSFATLWEFLSGGSDHRAPDELLPVLQRTGSDFADSVQGVRTTWLGHSTLLVEIEGVTILVDPVWGERASPSRFVGSSRFYAPPLALNELPPPDAILISHDHYDHLDLPTVRALAERLPRWIVPLGVGAHLESWGIPPELIEELDWWGETAVGVVRVASTPARHFSGRFVTDRDATLWSGWALLGTERRVWYSGDTAMMPEFDEIGRRYGPFDLTFIEAGAYDAAWTDVHLGPEQAVAAHRMVQRGTGGLMVPVHWGLFDLALHGWTEPVERVRVAAAAVGVSVAFPRPGESVSPEAAPTEQWWPTLPWETAAQAPAISTSLSDSVLALIPKQ